MSLSVTTLRRNQFAPEYKIPSRGDTCLGNDRIGRGKQGSFGKMWQISRNTSCFFITLIGAMFSVLLAGAEARELAVTMNSRLVCRFTAAPIDPACLNRSGTIELKGKRVFSARGIEFPNKLKVYEIDLNQLPTEHRFAITRRGLYVGNDSSTFELFQGDSRLHPARWPEAGFSREVKLDKDKKAIILSPDLLQRFATEPNLWIGGYWTADWAFETTRITKLVPLENKVIFQPLKAPGEIRTGFPFYVFNALGALTRPGDYVLDESTQTAYAASVNGSDIFEIGIEKTLLEIEGARNLTIRGLKLNKVLGTALIIRGSENVRIEGCEIRHSGSGAIVVDGGMLISVER